MKPYPLLFALLVLVASCRKEPPEEPEVQPPVEETRLIDYVIAVKYPPLIDRVSDGEELSVDIPFDKGDQLVVTGEGISGTLKYDKWYVYPDAVGFSGYLEYDGPGEPSKDLVLNVRLINPSLSNDGRELTEPMAANGLEEAVQRYGTFSGTCTYGNPRLELTQSTAFFSVILDFVTPISDAPGKKVTLINDGKTYGPFGMDIEYRGANLVFAFPARTKLVRPLVDVDGIARFPIMHSSVPATQETYVVEGGCHYEDLISMHDLSYEWVPVQSARAVVFQSDHTKPTDNYIMALGWSRNIYLSNLNVESPRTALSLLNDTFLWVDGECRLISADGSYSAIVGKSMRITGDGKLVAGNAGAGEGGAGICFGSIAGHPDDLVIEGGVSVEAWGAAGAAGIGTEQMEYVEYHCGSIIINTTGSVKATGGEGAPGIGFGRLNREGSLVSIGGIVISGGVVDATGGEGACDIGMSEAVGTTEGVTVSDSVTYDGVHGYHVAKKKGDVPIGYDKSR